MVNVSPAELAEIARQLFVPRIAADLGQPGTRALNRLLPVVRDVHIAVTTERLQHGLVILCPMEGDEPCLAAAFREIADLDGLTTVFDGQTPLTIQLSQSGYRVWMMGLDEPPASKYLAYHYRSAYDEIFFSDQLVYKVPEIRASPSYFGIPYFRELRVALEQYGVTWVRLSKCEIFDRSWLDASRNVFGPGPEVWMRRSLQRYLRNSFREHSSVLVEQNVNETRPVDVKVTWGPFKRVALIEIKWLGRSARAGEATATQRHSAQRARDGAQQLADYLDLYHAESAQEEARGYLTVFDGRRRGLRLPSTELSTDDAGYYRHEEIEYDAALLARPDFEVPIRFFCEPADPAA